MLSLLAAFAIHGPPPVLLPQEYAIDAGHSIVEFSIGFAFSRIKGRFTQVKGTILYDPADVAKSSVTVIIETNSLDTGWPHRDEHLRTSDFFDVERFPIVTFQSEQLRRSGETWLAEGPLTMRGVTRRIVIPFRFPQPPTRSPESRWMILNASGALRLARKDFGILGGDTFNSWFTRARNATMSDSVDIELEIEGWLADHGSARLVVVDVLVHVVHAQVALACGGELDARLGAAPFHRLHLVVDGAVRAVDGQLVAHERARCGLAERIRSTRGSPCPRDGLGNPPETARRGGPDGQLASPVAGDAQISNKLREPWRRSRSQIRSWRSTATR